MAWTSSLEARCTAEKWPGSDFAGWGASPPTPVVRFKLTVASE